jgi:hypothetical protein
LKPGIRVCLGFFRTLQGGIDPSKIGGVGTGIVVADIICN